MTRNCVFMFFIIATPAMIHAQVLPCVLPYTPSYNDGSGLVVLKAELSPLSNCPGAKYTPDSATVKIVTFLEQEVSPDQYRPVVEPFPGVVSGKGGVLAQFDPKAINSKTRERLFVPGTYRFSIRQVDDDGSVVAPPIEIYFDLEVSQLPGMAIVSALLFGTAPEDIRLVQIDASALVEKGEQFVRASFLPPYGAIGWARQVHADSIEDVPVTVEWANSPTDLPNRLGLANVGDGAWARVRYGRNTFETDRPVDLQIIVNNRIRSLRGYEPKSLLRIFSGFNPR